MISAVVEFQDKTVHVHNSPVSHVGKVMKSGFYTARATTNGLSIQTEKLKELHTPFYSETINDIRNIITAFTKEGAKEKVNGLGYLHKMGILLYGKQGTGKTSIMQYYANELMEKEGAIVLFCNNNSQFSGAVSLAKGLRDIQDTLIVLICDEFERFAKDNEAQIKSILDGQDSIDNCIVMASTNYLEQIPDTIKDRPSRFVLVSEVRGIEDESIIQRFLREKSSLVDPPLFSKREIKSIASELKKEGATIDLIKQRILSQTFKVTLKLSKKQMGFRKKEKTTFGDLVEESYSIQWSPAVDNSLELDKIDSSID